MEALLAQLQATALAAIDKAGVFILDILNSLKNLIT